MRNRAKFDGIKILLVGDVPIMPYLCPIPLFSSLASISSFAKIAPGYSFSSCSMEITKHSIELSKDAK